MFEKYTTVVESTETIKYTGSVSKVQGILIESVGPVAVVGECCHIWVPMKEDWIAAEVVGLRGPVVQLMAYTGTEGIEVGAQVVATGSPIRVPVSDKLLGRVLDSLGNPMDDGGEVFSSHYYPAMASPPNPLHRAPIRDQLSTGVRAIDALVPVGTGQRLGIFSGSGVGKSTLISMIARNTTADVNVIALIGERGREVREFIESDLGPEGLARSVLVVSTSDTPPLARLKGAYVATAVAEYFRDQGKNVMLLFDSVTRFARAQREVGLAIGEAPATRGFTPSVFEAVPKLMERAGTGEKGSITAFYTILVEGDDMDEPVADTVRGTLDGHLVLSRRLAQRNQFPAIDVLQSISRLTSRIMSPELRKAAGEMRRMMAVYAEAEDLINVGAYARGSNPDIDAAIALMPRIRQFLAQDAHEPASLDETMAAMLALVQPAPRGMTDDEEV